MASSPNGHLVALIQVGSNVTVFLGRLCKGQEAVDAGDGLSRFLNTLGLLTYLLAEFEKQVLLKLEDFLLGGEDLFLVLFQFRGNITLTSHQCLFADVVSWDGSQVSFGDLDEITKHPVVFDFEGRNSRFLSLLGFQTGYERLS